MFSLLKSHLASVKAFLALSGVPLGRGTVGSPSWLLLRQPWLLSGSSTCFLSPLRPPSARNTAVNPVLSLTPGPGEVSVMNCRAQDLPQGPSPHSQPGGSVHCLPYSSVSVTAMWPTVYAWKQGPASALCRYQGQRLCGFSSNIF